MPPTDCVMLLDYFLEHEESARRLARLGDAGTAYAPSFMAPFIAAAVAASRPGPWLVVAADGEAAVRLARELGTYLDREVPVLPGRGVPWGGDLTPAVHVVGERQRALLALQRGDLVVAEVAAALERFAPPSLQPEPLALAVDEEAGFERVLAALVALGYERCDQVRERGGFAVRGGIVDVYPSDGEPLRIEFWGDRIDSMRTFSVFSQRTAAPVPRAVVHAAIEVDASRADYRRAYERALGEAGRAGVDARDRWTIGAAEMDTGQPAAPNEEERGDPAVRAALRATEALSPQFVSLEELVSRTAGGVATTAGGAAADEGGVPGDAGAGSRPHGARLLVIDPHEVARTAVDAAGGPASVVAAGDADRFVVPLAGVRRWLASGIQLETVQRDQSVRFEAARPQVAARDINAAERDLASLLKDDYRVFVVFRHAGEAGRAAYRLKHLEARILDGPAPLAEREEPGLYFIAAGLGEGFISAELKLAVIPERALLRGARREARFVAGARLASFFDLRLHDFVVHEDFGIARFGGFQTRTVAGVTRDYLYLEFRGEDRLYLPHDQIGKITRYIGAGAGAPALNGLSGTAWQLVRTRARKAVAEMAGELLELYAARQATQGQVFGPDGELMERLEADFPYEETDDQAAAIADVKNDMEATCPMDRLVCGDVGYGKTEVAIRAALKAAESGRQTMLLVPTTILAQQHFATLGERFRDFPVRVEMVSRFRTAAETRRILREFREGRVDVLVGTHRLLSRDVVPHDLGLVIVDEEQRFGVRQKELLRQLRLQADVMSLSATPIPRTLQMSLSGIRDISVIETPPRGRHEIRTYIGEYRDEIVRAAIEKELARKGQAFYLHNRVETIRDAADHVRQLVPQARVAVAHGQMHEHELEDVMGAFLRGEDDVLVTTSIIESGIDIPSVNTLVVDRSDMLGLAQLYQIRGRIGRSDEHAYAYLLYPSEELLTGEAMARLRTLSDHTELGAGFKIAMADLEIRGAGNLLGDEQSGHVAAIGFEMYVQLLEEAVNELRGQPPAPQRTVRVEIPVSAYVPPEYIAYEATKIDAHRRIARARDLVALEAAREELSDRFGPPPEPVENLLALQEIRLKAVIAGVAAVALRGGRLTIDGLILEDDEAVRLRDLEQRAVYFKARAGLVAHPSAELAAAFKSGARPSPPPPGASLQDVVSSLRDARLAWVVSVLDAILAARMASHLRPRDDDAGRPG